MQSPWQTNCRAGAQVVLTTFSSYMSEKAVKPIAHLSKKNPLQFMGNRHKLCGPICTVFVLELYPYQRHQLGSIGRTITAASIASSWPSKKILPQL